MGLPEYIRKKEFGPAYLTHVTFVKQMVFYLVLQKFYDALSDWKLNSFKTMCTLLIGNVVLSNLCWCAPVFG